MDLAFPGGERLAFERGTLYPLAGLDPASADAYGALSVALDGLRGATLTIDQQFLDGQIDRNRAIELTTALWRCRAGGPARPGFRRTLSLLRHQYSTGEGCCPRLRPKRGTKIPPRVERLREYHHATHFAGGPAMKPEFGMIRNRRHQGPCGCAGARGRWIVMVHGFPESWYSWR